MTKQQIVKALEERMVYYNNEVEKWREIRQERPEGRAGADNALPLCLGKALAYEEAWKLIKGE